MLMPAPLHNANASNPGGLQVKSDDHYLHAASSSLSDELHTELKAVGTSLQSLELEHT
jgi:hypothetical protein